MEALVGVLIALIVSLTSNAMALVTGRRGQSRGHSVAFASGLIGLCAVPIWLIGGFWLAMQFMFASLQSIPGAMFVLGSLIIVVTSIVSVVQLVRLGRRPNNSSKPTPLRGAA